MSTKNRAQTLGQYVKAHRETALLSVTDAAKAAGLSRTVWEKVEADKPVRPLTVRKIAVALGKDPARFLELAGFSYLNPDDADPAPETLQGLIRRVERLEPLPQELADLRAEVRDLVTVVRSVHHPS